MNIKGFDKNLCCRGFQFEIGKEYKIDSDKLELCTDTVFHYCKSVQNVHYFYNVDISRFCEIEVLGEEVTDGTKCGSNHIRIVREIIGEELDELVGRVNGNTGLFNSGSWNSGNYNSGGWNSGDYNKGVENSGNCNSGRRNSGYCNSGNNNSGDNNSGSWNSGYWNSGYWNSGNWNRGDWNSGDFNSCENSNGVFCDEEDMNIRIFNKPSGMSLKQFRDSKYAKALSSAPFSLIEWVEDETKTEGYYPKKYTYREACANWWNELSDEAKETIKSIPNFDEKVFENITGIKVEKGEVK